MTLDVDNLLGQTVCRETAFAGLFANLQLVENCNGFSEYAANAIGSNAAVRLFAFHGEEGQRLTREFAERVQLAKLIEFHGLIVPYARELSIANSFIAYTAVPTTTLESNASCLPCITKFRLLTQVARTISESHRVGLYFGNLSASSILVDGANAFVDLLGILTTGLSEGNSCRETDDVVALAKLIVPVTHEIKSQCDQLNLPTRHLAILRVVLDDALTADASQVPTIIEIVELMESVCKSLFDDQNDQTLEKPAVGSVCDNDTTRVGFTGATNTRDTAQRIGEGSTIGRYRLEKLIGQGGMGDVYRAADLADGCAVAIKIIRSDIAGQSQAMRRLRKESRVMQDLVSPQIMRLIEAGEDKGIHFLALELIEGSELKKELKRRKKFEATEALNIITEIARGLSVAHRIGIVHRDIKPDNILLARKTSSRKSSTAPENKLLDEYAVKISDFGIARQMQQSASLEVTVAGALLGTPNYMSPEQCKGGEGVSPASDIYSLGIMLYEMIAGTLPFVATDPLKLVSMHCFTTAPDIRKVCPETPDAIADLIAQMLSKSQSQRFADADQLVEQIEKVTLGQNFDDLIHDKVVLDNRNAWMQEFVWDLKSSPEELWPYVSNTERLNRAVGLPSVSYRNEKDPKLGIRKFGSFRLGFITVAWEEHPFEWIEAQRMGVFRQFKSGPFESFLSTVKLEQLPDGGTRLRHTVKIAARNKIGKLLAQIEAGWKGHKGLDRVYNRIDEFLVDSKETKRALRGDAFEMPPSRTKKQLQRLKQCLGAAEKAGVDRENMSKLVDFVRVAPAQRLAKLKPFSLADELRISFDECLDLCLVATSVGLLEMSWDLLCPTCRAPADSQNLLSDISRHTHCEACDYDFATDLGNAVELVFAVASDIVEVDSASYCVGGPEHAPHVVAQTRIPAGECVEFAAMLTSGQYILRGPRLPFNTKLVVTDRFAPSTTRIELSAHSEATNDTHLRSGRQVIQLENNFETEMVVRLERVSSRNDAVTANQVASLERFRTLFPEQIVKAGRILEAEQVCILVSHLHDHSRIYDEYDEATAFEWLTKCIDQQCDIVRRNRGLVTKSLGEGIIAVFHDTLSAFTAATEMLNDKTEAIVVGDSPSPSSAAAFNVGLHRGRAFISSANGRVDYFGATLRVAQALPRANLWGLIMTDSVYNDPGVIESFDKKMDQIKTLAVDLPGLPNQLVQIVACKESGV